MQIEMRALHNRIVNMLTFFLLATMLMSAVFWDAASFAYSENIYGAETTAIEYNHDYIYSDEIENSEFWETGRAFVDYNDVLFEGSPYEPNQEMVKLAAALSAAACKGKTEDGDERQGSHYLKNAFREIGSNYSETYNYITEEYERFAQEKEEAYQRITQEKAEADERLGKGEITKEDFDMIIKSLEEDTAYYDEKMKELDDVSSNEHCFGIAHKNVGDNKYAVFIILRGTESTSEKIGDGRNEIDMWRRLFSDTSTTDKEFFEYRTFSYFSDFKDKVYNTLKYYVSQNEELKEANALSGSNVKFFITGHSLGGAAANLLAAQMDIMIDSGDNTLAKDMGWKNSPSKEDIFAYTFGALNSLGTDEIADQTREAFGNIHNYFNYYDTFGPNGSGAKIALGIKPADGGNSYKRKFGTIDSFEERFENVFKDKTMQNDDYLCHNMQGYYYAIANNSDNIFSKDYEREIALVLDVSGSMSGKPIEELKIASREFGNTVYSNDSRSLLSGISFSGDAHMIINKSENQELFGIAIDALQAGGGTAMEKGLMHAEANFSKSENKKIIVLMSDGEPNGDLTGDEIIDYANQLREDGIKIYALGFLSEVADSVEAGRILRGIADKGCYYEIENAEDIRFFFGDIADQLNGVKYHYIKIACPVDVTVENDGEILTSVNNTKATRTNFGTLTFEYDEAIEDPIKVLRLREGAGYDINIVGYGDGTMDYSIGFVDDEGEYSDIRTFSDIGVTSNTIISTAAETSDKTDMLIDEDGDGIFDIKLRASANQEAKKTFYIRQELIIAIASFIIGVLLIVIIVKKKMG